MQASSLLACLWPGLPRLWWRGDWRALLIAAFFAVAVNFGLMTTFIWPEMLSSRLQVLLWCSLLISWATAVAWGVRQMAALHTQVPELAQQDLFVQAQAEYLRGHWLEAESLLRQLMRRSDRERDAPLLLAAVYRRTARKQAAVEQLDALESMDGGGKWSLEIGRERRLLESMSEPGPERGTEDERGTENPDRTEQRDRETERHRSLEG